MPNRIIKESICTSDNLNELTPEEEVFFYRLLVNCDDFGRLDARPQILLAKCFPLKIHSITVEDIEQWLQALVKHDLVILYEVEGKQYLQMATWDKHQQKRAKNSKYPALPAHDSDASNLISSDIKCNQLQSNVPENRESRIENREYENTRIENRESSEQPEQNESCDDVTEPAESKKKDSKPKSQGKKNHKFSEEGREITKYLQEKLKNAGVDHFPRDWLLKNYATADRLLKTIPKHELKECITWAMDDQFWKSTINDLLGVEKAYMQFKRKGVKANGMRSQSIPGQGRRELYSEEDRENAATWEW